MTAKLTPCRFYFGDDPTYDGFTDGTTWNGFENIWVTAEVHKEIVERFEADYKVMGYKGDELAEAMESFDIEPDDDGLYSYAYGFATSIDDEPMYSEGDRVRIKAEHCGEGERDEVYIVREDSRDDRGEMPRINISAERLRDWAIWPIERIDVDKIEKL